MDSCIKVEGGAMASVEAACAIAGAIESVLTVGGQQRTPEGVMVCALEVIRAALTPAGGNLSVLNSHFVGERNVEVSP